MTKTPLDRLSDAYGLLPSYLSETKERHFPSDVAKRAILRAMNIAADDDVAIKRSLADAPEPIDHRIAAPDSARCFMPDWLGNGRIWGVTCQLYGLRSTRNHGIGDFEDLARLAESVAAKGADFIGVNPVHALFTADPERCSPFSPSNRRFLNPLYIALDHIPGLVGPLSADEAALARLRASPQVDYSAVAAFKLGTLQALWMRIGDDPERWQSASRASFASFVEAGGARLFDHALFEALSHHMVAAGQGAGWHGWPEAYRTAARPAVRQFAAEHGDAVRFHLWLQWIADAQLRRACDRARAAGMRIGLYLDLAVGAASDGSANWSDPEAIVSGVNIGAPPDSFFHGGQDWGLAPLSPAALRAQGAVPYRQMLAANMRHAGAIRIDHAMSLYRLFWIPHGMAATEGCYVLYPLADMLRVLGEVSTAQETVVIGEDLGTVPKGFREMMQKVDMISCRILYFEKTRRGYRAAASYPRNTFVSASTHDLPPLAAWWTGADIALFRSLGLLDAAATKHRQAARAEDRRALIARLRKDLPKRFSGLPAAVDADPEGYAQRQDVAVAVHAFLARTPSRIVALQLEDLCGAEVPVNIPGTSDEYPNWRLRAPVAIEDVAKNVLSSAIIEAVAAERPKAP